jgi:hypothetical protein
VYSCFVGKICCQLSSFSLFSASRARDDFLYAYFTYYLFLYVLLASVVRRMCGCDMNARRFCFSLVSFVEPGSCILAGPDERDIPPAMPSGCNAVMKTTASRSSFQHQQRDSQAAWVEPVASFTSYTGSMSAQTKLHVSSVHGAGAGFVIFNMHASGPAMCGIAGSVHTSVGIYYIVDMKGGCFRQKCRASGCVTGSGPWVPLPKELWHLCLGHVVHSEVPS